MAIRRRGDPDATDPNQQAAHDLAIRRRCQQLQQQEQECYMCEHLGRLECRPTASFIKIQCCNCYGTIERIPLGTVRPARLLRVLISEGLTQADS